MFANMLASTVNGAGAGHGGDHGKESGSLLKKVVSNGDLSSVAVNGSGGGPPIKASWDKKKLGLVRCWHLPRVSLLYGPRTKLTDVTPECRWACASGCALIAAVCQLISATVCLSDTYLQAECNTPGETTVIQADKHVITQALGVQIRDLRLLDPQLSTSYPSAILCREQALVRPGFSLLTLAFAYISPCYICSMQVMLCQAQCEACTAGGEP